MEKREGIAMVLQDELNKGLSLWQNDSKNAVFGEAINQTFAKAVGIGLSLELKINIDELLKSSEGLRAFKDNDLLSWTKDEGDNIVFNLKPKKGGLRQLKVIADYLVISDNKYGEMVPASSFMPNEIESILLK